MSNVRHAAAVTEILLIPLHLGEKTLEPKNLSFKFDKNYATREQRE